MSNSAVAYKYRVHRSDTLSRFAVRAMSSASVVIQTKLNPTVLSFFRSLNEIEYSANIKFDTLKPFGDDIARNPLVYRNCRRYYERPNKIVWTSDDGHEHDIVNIVRVDGGFGEGNAEAKISTKFKIYKEKFSLPSASDSEQQKQYYSLTGSIELPVNNVVCDKFKKSFKKMLYITYWHLLIDDRFVFRVAFRENAINEEIQCNIECETQSITRKTFVEYFQLLKSHYIQQNENMQTIEPWSRLMMGDMSLSPNICVISKERANAIDSQFITETLDGKLL